MTDPLDDITAAYEALYVDNQRLRERLQEHRHWVRTTIPVLLSAAESSHLDALRDTATEGRRLLDLEEHE